MKKQIIFTKFIPRIFAAMLDLALLNLAIAPFMNIVSQHWFSHVFNDFLTNYAIDTSNLERAMYKSISMPEFINDLTLLVFFTYFGVLVIIFLIVASLYFIFFWHKFGATPGKMLLRMKIVDANSYEKPTLHALVRRFLAYNTLILGLWQIIFSQKGQAMHDKIAGTVVIKS